MTDPIADLLTRIRNAYMAGRTEVVIPFSNLKHNLLNKLKELNYIGAVEVDQSTLPGNLKAQLIYKNNQPVVTQLKRMSKPGRRLYTSIKHVKTPLAGHGVTILTTSRGILTDREARQQGIGGEIICRIW